MSSQLACVITANAALGTTLNATLTTAQFCSTVKTFATYAEALSQLKGTKLDLALVDLSVASVSEFCEFVQKFKRIPGTKGSLLLLIVKSIDAKVAAIATEYAVSRVILQSNVLETLRPAILALVEEKRRPSNLKSALLRLDMAAEKQAYGEVDRLVEDLFTLYPDHPRCLIEYGNLCLRRNQFADASEILEKAQKNYPDHIRVLNFAARVKMKQGNFADALATLERADILSPKNVDRLALFGDVYRASGDATSARAYYDQALEINESHKEAKLGLGVVELAEGELNAALDLFRDSASEEEIAGLFNNSAIIAVKKKDFSNAVRLYLAARGSLHKESLQSRVVFNLGLAYRKSNQPSKALQAFEEAAKLDPDFDRPKKLIAATVQKAEEPQATNLAAFGQKETEELHLEFYDEGAESGSELLEQAFFAMEDSLGEEVLERSLEKNAESAEPIEQESGVANLSENAGSQPESRGLGRISVIVPKNERGVAHSAKRDAGKLPSNPANAKNKAEDGGIPSDEKRKSS